MKDLILSNITKYKDFEEFSKYKNMDEENGIIIDITCGTYNGATNTFTPWRITDDNIIDTFSVDTVNTML